MLFFLIVEVQNAINMWNLTLGYKSRDGCRDVNIIQPRNIVIISNEDFRILNTNKTQIKTYSHFFYVSISKSTLSFIVGKTTISLHYLWNDTMLKY